MKKRKSEKLILSVCMIIIVCFSLATATFAWYAGTDPTIMENLKLQLDDKGELRVEIGVESGGRMEMSKVDESGASIDLALSKLINIEENKLGPGAFGEVHIYISSASANYTGYTIKIIPNCDLIEDGDEEALELAKEHIRFYAAKNEDEYAQLIPYEIDGVRDTIAFGEQKEVVLYWYWPYEYEDVPDQTEISAKDEREYDLQDTVIGNYIQSIGFTFVVEGNTDEW